MFGVMKASTIRFEDGSRYEIAEGSTYDRIDVWNADYTLNRVVLVHQGEFRHPNF